MCTRVEGYEKAQFIKYNQTGSDSTQKLSTDRNTLINTALTFFKCNILIFIHILTLKVFKWFMG